MEELIKYKFKNTFYIKGGRAKVFDEAMKEESCIVVSMIQTFIKIPPRKYVDFFDITMIDEAHHVCSLTSQYGTVMSNNLSPRRYGFTATMPIPRKQRLINEGLIGPPISTLTTEQGIEEGIIATPKINLVPVPYETKVNIACSTYQQYYDLGVVHNKRRNRLIVEAAMNSIKQGEITLIIIEREAHGLELANRFKRANITVPFVFGNTPSNIRVKTKKGLSSGAIRCAICSRIWKEGINIPELNHIINAVGMKEEKNVIQVIGRGLRTTATKKTINLTDLLDPYKYLAEHSILRLHVYIRKGWI